MFTPGASVIQLRAVSLMTGDAAPLTGVDLHLRGGEVTVLHGGPASTAHALLQVLSLHEPPAAGEVMALGEATAAWPEEQRATFRTHRVGMVYAAPFLLPALTAIENVAMPILKRAGEEEADHAGDRAQALLEEVDLAGFEEDVAGDLSAPEQYRVAIARALAHDPALLVVEALDAHLSGDALQSLGALLHRLAVTRTLAVAVGVSATVPASLGARVLELGAWRGGPAQVPISGEVQN